MSKQYSLSAIAAHIGTKIQDDTDLQISGLAPLDQATTGQLSFLSNKAYLSTLRATKASAVIIADRYAKDCPTTCLVARDPYVAFAKATQLFAPVLQSTVGIHPTAIIGANCIIPDSVSIGAYTMIGQGVQLGENTVIGSHCSIADHCQLGANVWLRDRVQLYHSTQLGDFVSIHSGTVLGADGFGFANDQGHWQKVHQLGRVIIGSHVEIGANTCIDRGALADTVIGNHVIIDNLVQIAHNVQVGDGTAIAGCTGVAGSAKIGRYCQIGGHVSINGHISICDKVSIVGASVVYRDIVEPGAYASSTIVQPFKQWLKTVSYTHKLPKLVQHMQQLEKQLTRSSRWFRWLKRK